MPYINVKTNSKITKESKELLKAELGNAISAIPGKSEAWLMVNIDNQSDMWFKGDDADCAMFEVSIFGKANNDAYDDLTRRICSASLKCLGVSPERTYIKYTEIEHWGYNNFNF